MGMNPDTNRFEPLTDEQQEKANADHLDDLREALGQATGRLLRPDGTEVPKHWSTFRLGEDVVIKGYTFRVAYIGEATLLLEPVGPVIVESADEAETGA